MPLSAPAGAALSEVTPDAEICRMPALAEAPAGAIMIADARTATTADDVASLCLNTLPSC